MFGNSGSYCFIPNKFLVYQFGPVVCSLATKTYILTSYNIANKTGAKIASLKKIACENYLVTFCEIDDNLSFATIKVF